MLAIPVQVVVDGVSCWQSKPVTDIKQVATIGFRVTGLRLRG